MEFFFGAEQNRRWIDCCTRWK